MRNQKVTDFSSQVFEALSDPTRRAILDLLRARGKQPAGTIADDFSVSRPAVSKHLRILRNAKLVREDRQGRHRFYRLQPEPLRKVDTWLSSYRVFWQTRLQHLKMFVEDGAPSNKGTHRPRRKDR
jgi:DNA-binding transcriptional ArsR family regulator